MESRFGHDFSRVRVHADAKAAQSADAVASRAYTVGQQIVFGGGRYAPHHGEGRQLLAHELTHTIQQSGFEGGAGHRSAPLPLEPAVTNSEQAAEACGRRVGRAAPIVPLGQPALQRQPAGPAPTAPAAQSEGEPLFTIFVADERKRRDPRFARTQAQADAARIRKSGTLSSEERQLVNAKLRFFAGEAWEIYGREIRPALAAVAAADQERQQQKQEYDGMAAYYASTRQSAVDLHAAQQAKFREELPHLSGAQIDAQWSKGGEAFVAVASSAGNHLAPETFFRVWLRHWDERWKLGRDRVKRIADRESNADFGEYLVKLVKFEDGELDILGSDYRRAKADVGAAESMFRSSVVVMEYLWAAQAQGKTLTLDEVNQYALLHDKITAPIREGGWALGLVPRPPGMIVGASPQLLGEAVAAEAEGELAAGGGGARPPPGATAAAEAAEAEASATAEAPASAPPRAPASTPTPVASSTTAASSLGRMTLGARLGYWIRSRVLQGLIRGAEMSEVFPNHSPGGTPGARQPVPTLTQSTARPSTGPSQMPQVQAPAGSSTAAPTYAPTATTAPNVPATSVPATPTAVSATAPVPAATSQFTPATAAAANAAAPHAEGAEVVQVSAAEYAQRLSMVTPEQHNNPVLVVIETAGQVAAAVLTNPNTPNGAQFIQACQNRNWALAGTLFHAEAARQLRALATSLPGTTITAEDTVQAGAGGSRLDATAVDGAGNHYNVDWKTTGRSALGSKARAELARHATQYQANRGAPLTLQISKSWVDFVRPFLRNIRWPK